ncbi:MAG: nucleotidyltransferase domain-containing protein [Geopsychrobacter sp.]|nr:nucleotidyltransferase domain-containing protein [Geopsychrobacter sp.]
MARANKYEILEEPQIEAVVRQLTTLPGLVAAFLHGSAVKGRLRAESDIDIALLFQEQSPSASFLLELAVDLETCVGRPVHLGVLSCDSLIYATEVYRHGRELFCVDEELKDRFFMRMLSAYADFNRARREVLNAYLIREDDGGYSAE